MPDGDNEAHIELGSDTVKFDLGLRLAFLAWQGSADTDTDTSMAITLVYTGDLASIEALGFTTHADFDGQAAGVVRFADMVSLAANEGVVRLIAGMPRVAQLNRAAPDIRARAAALSGGTPAGGVWYVDETSGQLTAGKPTGSGKDVIVAFIDSGIDYTHPMFHASLGPPITTRILAIWDQGLLPSKGESGPPTSLLVSKDTYGVQYERTAIQTALNVGPPLPHQDCLGHGTHVAGIAAGGPLVAPAYPAKYVGVAPEAFIIMVKEIDISGSVRYHNGGGTVSEDNRMQDAVMYCLRKAAEFGKPVVISVSLESPGQPGDGLDTIASWIDGVVSPNTSTNGFPKGAIVVKGAGNRHGQSLTGRVTVPGGGTVTVPVKLSDHRSGATLHWVDGKPLPYAPPMTVRIWYRPSAGNAVSFGIRTQYFPTYMSSNTVSGYGAGDFGLQAQFGSPPVDAIVTPYGGSSQYHGLVQHSTRTVKDPRGGSFDLALMEFSIEPRTSGTSVLYHEAVYEFQISASATTDFYIDGETVFWLPGEYVSFEVGASVLDESTITDPWGRNVITVAAYQVDGSTGSSPIPAHGIASFSGRGPLRDFSAASRGALAPKPDIAAPGVQIRSAASAKTHPAPPSALTTPGWTTGNRVVPYDGTSQATPMVAGVVALLLEKNKNLNVDDVRGILKSGAHGAPNYLTPTKTTQAYGLGMVDALASMLFTP